MKPSLTYSLDVFFFNILNYSKRTVKHLGSNPDVRPWSYCGAPGSTEVARCSRGVRPVIGDDVLRYAHGALCHSLS